MGRSVDYTKIHQGFAHLRIGNSANRVAHLKQSITVSQTDPD